MITVRVSEACAPNLIFGIPAAKPLPPVDAPTRAGAHLFPLIVKDQIRMPTVAKIDPVFEVIMIVYDLR